MATSCIDGLLTVVEFLFSSNMKNVSSYRLTLRKFKAAYGTRRAAQVEWSHRLCFWCLNPAVAFAPVEAATHSIILTSGTLSPLDSFASELGINFRHRLEAAHVVDRSQIWASVLTHGVNGIHGSSCEYYLCHVSNHRLMDYNRSSIECIMDQFGIDGFSR